ncbi:hypothetical protein [Thiocystis violacea]|uniref:hypothetical protein n=1 Tax=Thiocystis violacea TaxID=13725 RepID=UPI0019060B40|nr:hypothetical protein [Thiocystis violacea]MBK1718672.1 hypothetical protein [Thiocystis violacea]
MKIKGNVALSLIAVGLLQTIPGASHGTDAYAGGSTHDRVGAWVGWSSDPFFNHETPYIGDTMERSEFSDRESRMAGTGSSWDGWSSNTFFQEVPDIGGTMERSEFSALESDAMGTGSSMSMAAYSSGHAERMDPGRMGPWSDGSLDYFERY